MLVDFAPYVFRGKLAGYLTRLSASGLANVTSGGGQVPAFVTETAIADLEVDFDPHAGTGLVRVGLTTQQVGSGSDLVRVKVYKA